MSGKDMCSTFFGTSSVPFYLVYTCMVNRRMVCRKEKDNDCNYFKHDGMAPQVPGVVLLGH